MSGGMKNNVKGRILTIRSWPTIRLRMEHHERVLLGCLVTPFRIHAMLDDFKHAIRAVAGKWKLEILFVLRNGAMRFGAVRRSLDGITQHMLTMQLRELEQDGLVSRTV